MDAEERNYCCLALLLLRVGNPCLRIYFKNQWNAAGRYTPWTDCAQNGSDLLRMFKPLPYEKDTVKSGDTSEWDLSLFVKALLHSRPPFVVTAHLVTALEKLKDMRNQLCHSPVPRVQTTDFQKLWIDGCHALTLFGATAADFDQVKEDLQKPWSELLPLMKHCADQDQAILDGLNCINGKLEQLQEGQKAIMDTVVEGQARLQENMEKQARQLKELTLNVQTTSDLPPEKDLSSTAQEYTAKLRGSIKQQTDFLLTSEEEEKKIRTDDIFTNVTIVRGKKQQLGIRKYFKDNKSMKKRVPDHIRTNAILQSFANIPVMCFLMCYHDEKSITLLGVSLLKSTQVSRYFLLDRINNS